MSKIRISKLALKLNVSIAEIVKCASLLNHEIDTSPNTFIEGDLYIQIVEWFENSEEYNKEIQRNTINSLLNQKNKKSKSKYIEITVESFIPEDLSVKHGDVHIRPVKGEVYETELFVACSKSLSYDYPVGTKFKLNVKLTQKEDGAYYLYSHYSWPYKVVKS